MTLTDRQVDAIVLAAKSEVAKLVNRGDINPNNSYYWMLANARVRARAKRKGKNWSEARILRKTRIRYGMRRTWQVVKLIAPKPLGGALVSIGEQIERGADSIADALRSGKL